MEHVLRENLYSYVLRLEKEIVFYRSLPHCQACADTQALQNSGPIRPGEYAGEIRGGDEERGRSTENEVPPPPNLLMRHHQAVNRTLNNFFRAILALKRAAPPNGLESSTPSLTHLLGSAQDGPDRIQNFAEQISRLKAEGKVTNFSEVAFVAICRVFVSKNIITMKQAKSYLNRIFPYVQSRETFLRYLRTGLWILELDSRLPIQWKGRTFDLLKSGGWMRTDNC